MVTEREQAGVMTTDLSLMGRIRKTGMYVRERPDHISFLFKYTITMHKSFTAHTKRSHRQNQMCNTKELIPYLLGNTVLSSLPQFLDTWDISFYSGFCPKNNNLVPGTVTGSNALINCFILFEALQKISTRVHEQTHRSGIP